jgi:hypothetical protein
MSVCVFIFVRSRMSVRACPCAYACLCERMCVCSRVSIGLRHRARVCSECVRAARRCARPPIAQRRFAVSIARPAPRVGGRARVVAVGATGRARPQVSRGRAARPRRNGLREMGTRPWSTPPAPSTSSAAKATPPATSRTCTRAPTEVQRWTRSRGGSRGALRGVKGLKQGC